MTSSDQVGRKAAFDFYNGFLTVVYGLLITNGLGYVVGFMHENPTHGWDHALLFLGTFLITLHFWFVWATNDELSTDFYRVLVGTKKSLFGVLVLFDIAVAAVFAAEVLAMFDAMFDDFPNERFFFWFFVAAVSSLVYDVYSRMLIWARQPAEERDDESTIQRYRSRVSSWIKEDAAYAAASGGLYFAIARKILVGSFALGSICLLTALFLLAFDLWSSEINGRQILAPTDIP